VSREPVLQALVGRAQRMVRSGHFAASRIEACSNELTERLAHLRDLASVRRLRLLDALESQMVSIVHHPLNSFRTSHRISIELCTPSVPLDAIPPLCVLSIIIGMMGV